MKKLLLIHSILLLLFMNGAFAQGYKTGIGVRGGVPNGITFKQFISETSAIEGIVAWRYKGTGIIGLFEMHRPAFGVENLHWFYGLGGHVSFRSYYRETSASLFVGIDGILGIEYQIPDIPFTISLDYKPA